MDYLASLFIAVMIVKEYAHDDRWYVLMGIGIAVFVVVEIVIGFLMGPFTEK